MENKPMRLLLIEDDVNECNKFKKLEQEREDIKFIGITDSDIEGVKYVKMNMPEGIILDLELNKGKGNGNGFEFLNNIKKLNLSIVPKIVVTTNVCSTSVYDYLHANGVDLIFYKKQINYSVEKVINTLILLREYRENFEEKTVEQNDDNNEIILNKIEAELDLIGIGTHLQGRKYLRDAILFLLTNGSEEKVSIIQYLGEKYKKSHSTISRAMQNALLYAWRISSIEDLTEHYKAKINYETGVPTPTEFVYYYVDKIKKSM